MTVKRELNVIELWNIASAAATCFVTQWISSKLIPFVVWLTQLADIGDLTFVFCSVRVANQLFVLEHSDLKEKNVLNLNLGLQDLRTRLPYQHRQPELRICVDTEAVDNNFPHRRSTQDSLK